MPEFSINGVILDVPDAVLTPRIADKLSTGQYENAEARAAQMRLRKGWRVLELGAGLGYIGSLCAGIVGSENLTSVEANPEMIDVIRGNLDRNGHGEATLIHGAVTGDDDTRAHLTFNPTGTFWSGHIDEAGDAKRAVEVPMLRIGDLLAMVRPHVVIMDVEGAEERFFDAPWPDHVRHVMMELHPKRYADTVIQKIVDCMSVSGLTYDPGPSKGAILCFKRVRGR